MEHVPSAVERAADPADLQMIRTLYGSRSQTILNALLAFDAFFSWYMYYPFEHVKKTGKTVDTIGYRGSMALSTLNHLLVNRYLKKGDDIFATPASRRAERLFGVN
eukprot:3049485-Prymnesium_polylepis.1